MQVRTIFTVFPVFCTALPPIVGPLLPRPSQLSTSALFAAAAENLTSILDNAVLSSFGQNASFSVAVTATEDTLWEYHHLASEHDSNGTDKADGDSQYMVGSVTKVFTDLLLLRSGIDLDSFVTEHLPELPNDWSSIRVSELMDHLSGIPQNYGFPEVYTLVPLYQQLGFPPVPDSEFSACGVIGLNAGCNTSQLLTGLSRSRLVFQPGTAPSYNNIAFALLGIILERHQNDTFQNILDSFLAEANMTNSGMFPSDKGNTSNAVIPTSDSSWASEFGINAPQGGMFSTTNDLSKFARTILARSAKLKVNVDSWLKPHALLPSPRNSIGAPWEIYRSEMLEQPFDVYAKDGGVVSYFSRMALVPSFGIAVTCLTAGPVGTLDAVMETVFGVLMPAIDRATQEEAKNLYAGVYTAEEGNVTLGVEDGRGISVVSIYRDGNDMLSAIRTIFESNIVVPGELSDDWRIYPAGMENLETLVGPDGMNQTFLLEDWRLGFDTHAFDIVGDLARYDNGVFDDNVSSWQALDSMYYGGRAVDRIVIVKSQDGREVVGLKLPALRLDLWKQ